jgi:PERQ amino acid-rich with GYF domain-containing protein
MLPLDNTIIADAVYANSQIMDGRHFGEEYVRRKRLADKGIVDKQTPATESKGSSASSGWSEVAKKSGPNGGAGVQQQSEGAGSMQGAGFKVVPSRKKGKK